MDIYDLQESAVRSYSRAFPAHFATAKGATVTDEAGRSWIDFLSGCGALNYGHNPEPLKRALLDYVEKDGLALGLDMHHRAKAAFLTAIREILLAPRGLDYRVQFTGPTGTNAVEAALKLARKVTGRHTVVAFTNGFHGCTLGALAATGSGHHRGGSGPLMPGVIRHPFDGYFGPGIDTTDMLETLLDDPSSGIDAPAAILVEAVQGEGGLNVAGGPWLRRIAEIARARGILLIVDDIQAGCGRTGRFFAFEDLGVEPDMVTLSKSLSGFGLPLAVVLLRPEFDRWQPGEHNGTFRGNALGFVTATAALETYWATPDLTEAVAAKGEKVRARLQVLADRHGGHVKGRGMMLGLEVGDTAAAEAIRTRCFEAGLILELCGPRDTVVKLLPPLTIDDATLARGCAILDAAVDAVLGSPAAIEPGPAVAPAALRA
jgi:diaminobutyrate-2-oxoglutarate transaminase